MSINRIESISFLSPKGRRTISATPRGMFRSPAAARTARAYMRPLLTAQEILTQTFIKDCDPVMTLTDGRKIRVYKGGSSSFLMPQAEGIFLKHDGTFVEDDPDNSIVEDSYDIWSEWGAD